MSSRFSSFSSVIALVAACGALGCSEVRGRKKIQEANELYKRGRYQEAVTAFEAAEALVPSAADAVAEQGLHLPPAHRARRARSGEPAGRRRARWPRSAGWASWRRATRAPTS